MTVKELMEILAKVDPDMPVCLFNGEFSSYDEIFRVQVEKFGTGDTLVIV